MSLDGLAIGFAAHWPKAIHEGGGTLALFIEEHATRRSAALAGIKHGALCAGCCWLLMALLFVAGVMNMYWVAAITVLVILEKISPQSWKLLRVAVVLLIGWGAWVVVSGAG